MRPQLPTTRATAMTGPHQTVQIEAIELSRNHLKEMQAVECTHGVGQSGAEESEQQDAGNQISEAPLGIVSPRWMRVRHDEMPSYRFQQDLVDMGLIPASELVNYDEDVPEATDRILEDKPANPRHVSRMRLLEDGIDLSARVDVDRYVEDHMSELDRAALPEAKERKPYFSADDFHTMQDVALGARRDNKELPEGTNELTRLDPLVVKIDNAAYKHPPKRLVYSDVDVSFGIKTKRQMKGSKGKFASSVTSAHGVFAPKSLLEDKPNAGSAAARGGLSGLPTPQAFSLEALEEDIAFKQKYNDKIDILLQQKLIIDTEDGWRARDPLSGEAVSSDTTLGKEALEIMAEFLDDSNDEWFRYEWAMRAEEPHPNGELVRDDLFWMQTRPTQSRRKAKPRSRLTLAPKKKKVKSARRMLLIHGSEIDESVHLRGFTGFSITPSECDSV